MFTCISVYFPMWFEIKKQNQIIHGAKNFFNLVHCIQQFPHSKICSSVLKVVERNTFFAHPENVFLGMLGDNDVEITRLTVNKIQALQGKSLQHTILMAALKEVTSRIIKKQKVLLT